MEPASALHEVDQRLHTLWGDPRVDHEDDPLEILIRTILSQNTSDRNRDRAYDALRARYPGWVQVLEAPTEAVAEAIRGAGLHQQRAARIKSVLRTIQDGHGALSLAFLNRMADAEAHDWLLSLPGVGRKTAAIVLLFAFGRPFFPVDTHVERVTRRLGILAGKGDPHDLLAALVPAGREGPLHLNLIRLGREICHARRPACPACPLADLCAHVRRKLDPAILALLTDGSTLPALVRRAGHVEPTQVDRPKLLALAADPTVDYVEAAGKLSPKG